MKWSTDILGNMMNISCLLYTSIMAKAKEKGVNFLIPVDNVIANKFAEDAQWQIVDSDQIPEGWMGLDLSLIHI